ncbi:3-deoxy-D-manno-octulosonic acid transferase [Alteromonas sp. H39]|uniref:3-deoxy-D-manno-octulosonic acid transferase n=1 Tax=Alteromonas sp. H39 TaxID=3389876 RepID=UPI0039E0F8E8
MNSTETPYSPTLAHTLARWCYTLLLAIATPFAAVNLWLKTKRQPDAFANRQKERFGLVPAPASAHGYLFHCVSVGEVVAASSLIKRIMDKDPNVAVTVTTTTATGSARAKDIFGEKVNIAYLPFDLPVTMNVMLTRLKPKIVVITEVELWPNLIHRCWLRKIPVVVINARMTGRSASRYAKVSALFTPMLHKVSHVCAQGERDYVNYKKLGIGHSKITLTNNIKFDQALVSHTDSAFLGLQRGMRRIVVAGSTHEPEEQVLLEVYNSLASSYPDLLLILVPRHPERFAAVAKLLETKSVRFVKSSQCPSVSADCGVVLVDEMGKLNQVYQIADYSFVGGSLADKGGHNALEPAAVGVPVIMGPYTYNNPVICQYLEEKGALNVVRDAGGIQNCLTSWLNKPEEAQRAGRAGQEVIRANSGALEKTLSCLEGILR